MRWVRVLVDGRVRFGVLREEGQVQLVAGSPFAVEEGGAGAPGAGGSRAPELEPDGPPLPLAAVRLLAPCTPTKIVAAGLNYRDHAQELGLALPEEPILFLKPSTAVIGPEEEIVLPAMSRQVDYEAELAAVVGRRCRNLSPDRVPQYLLGYTCFNDVTARDLQRKDGQWTRAKSFDTFAPLGPCITDEIDPDDVAVELYLNGERRQSSTTRNLIFSVAELVSFVSRIMTLEPGDVIATGTPSGIGPLSPGDVVEVAIPGIGRLRNRVRG
ncbi:MAG: fumarylacetoacetate hydrolase family protein [Bacillota bacterium]|nr:fumarylacetoacetate hydrolase family protein [Bacillota bacterium]